jgi:hypothetical protein
VARAVAQHQSTPGQATWPDQRAKAGEGPPGQNLRGEINDMRKRIAELAMERDVLESGPVGLT